MIITKKKLGKSMYFIASKKVHGEDYEYAHKCDITEEDFVKQAGIAFRSAKKYGKCKE